MHMMQCLHWCVCMFWWGIWAVLWMPMSMQAGSALNAPRTRAAAVILMEGMQTQKLGLPRHSSMPKMMALREAIMHNVISTLVLDTSMCYLCSENNCHGTMAT